MSKIYNLIKRAIITLSSKDDTDFQICQVKYLGKIKNIELISPYGLYSNPSEKSLVLMFNINGNEETTIGIPYNPYNRFKGNKKGEVVVGNPETQTRIYFKTNGDIDIESSGAVNINSSGAVNINSSGAVNINGDTEPIIRGNAMATLFNSHKHTSAIVGLPTSAPLTSMSSAELSSKNFTE